MVEGEISKQLQSKTKWRPVAPSRPTKGSAGQLGKETRTPWLLSSPLPAKARKCGTKAKGLALPSLAGLLKKESAGPFHCFCFPPSRSSQLHALKQGGLGNGSRKKRAGTPLTPQQLSLPCPLPSSLAGAMGGERIVEGCPGLPLQDWCPKPLP